MEQFSNESASQSHVNVGGAVFDSGREMKFFQYGILRFWEKYSRETVFSRLDGAGNYCKK